MHVSFVFVASESIPQTNLRYIEGNLGQNGLRPFTTNSKLTFPQVVQEYMQYHDVR